MQKISPGLKLESRSEPIETVIDGERGQPPTESERKFMDSVGEINLIVGGPLCQGNSNLNNHTRGTDERNLLYLRMARMIEILKFQNTPSLRMLLASEERNKTSSVRQKIGLRP